MDSAVRMLGLLVFAWGAAIIAIAVFGSFRRVKSPTRHLADAMSGAFFCLLASIVAWGAIPGATQKLLGIAALVAGAASWGLGRYARRVDRTARKLT